MVSIVQLLLSAFRKQCQQKSPLIPKGMKGQILLFRFFLSRAAGPEIVVHRDKHQVVAGVRFRIISDDKSVRYAFDGNGHIRFVQKVAVAVHKFCAQGTPSIVACDLGGEECAD